VYFDASEHQIGVQIAINPRDYPSPPLRKQKAEIKLLNNPSLKNNDKREKN
jgi:hypothetical protein